MPALSVRSEQGQAGRPRFQGRSPRVCPRPQTSAPVAGPRKGATEHLPHRVLQELTRAVQRSRHRGVGCQSAASVAAGTGACGACQMSHGTAHGTALFAAHFVHFCTSLPHPPHSRTPRQNPKPLQTGALQCYQSPSLSDSVPALSLPKGTLRLLCRT